MTHWVHLDFPSHATDSLRIVDDDSFYPLDCLGFGAPQCSLGAVSRVNRNPQTHRIYAMSDPRELKIHKGEEVQSKEEEGKINLAYKHSLKTNFGVGLFLFQTTRPGWMEYPGKVFEDV